MRAEDDLGSAAGAGKRPLSALVSNPDRRRLIAAEGQPPLVDRTSESGAPKLAAKNECQAPRHVRKRVNDGSNCLGRSANRPAA